MSGRHDEQEMLDHDQDSTFTNWTQNSFKYVNMGPVGILQSIIKFVIEKRKLLLPLLVFVLIAIGFFIDISHGVRLSKLEESHDYIRSMFDYDYSDEGVETDILVNIDVLSTYGKDCHPFFCPSNHHYCYCLSEDFSNFQTANRTCVERLNGQLLQIKDREEESTFLSRFHRSSSSYRKSVFWVGVIKREGEEPSWINCTSCDKPSTLKSHLKKIENVTHGMHSCLMMTEGILQKYPCQSARLSEWERKYVTYEEDKKPYWFDQELIEHSYGLNALCECNTLDRAKAIESDSSPLVCLAHYYTITKRKFLDQEKAEQTCAEGSDGSCYLVSFESRSEQTCISNLALWRSQDETMVWIGGKKVSVGNSEYKWAYASCKNQDLDFGTTMKESTQCYGFGRAAVGQWMPVLHARSCEDYLPFFCQVSTHKLKAAKAATDKQISLKLIQHLGKLCEPLDCSSSYKCYCTLRGRRPTGWKEALIGCGLEDMDLAVINDKREYNFLTGETKLMLKGYVAAHDFHDDKKLTWVNEGGKAQAQIEVDDDVIISNWTITKGGCLLLNRGDPPFVLQNCDIPEAPLCEFDVKKYQEKWVAKTEDYHEYY